MCHKPLIILLFLIYVNYVQSYAFQFPDSCGPQEISVRCALVNQPSCSSPEGSGRVECNGHCICKENYLRDNKGKCIPMGNCSGLCPKNAVFERCSQKYKQRCVKDTEDGRLDLCILGCSCKRGYYWSEKTDSCLKSDECLAAERQKTLPRIG